MSVWASSGLTVSDHEPWHPTHVHGYSSNALVMKTKMTSLIMMINSSKNLNAQNASTHLLIWVTSIGGGYRGLAGPKSPAKYMAVVSNKLWC